MQINEDELKKTAGIIVRKHVEDGSGNEAIYCDWYDQSTGRTWGVRCTIAFGWKHLSVTSSSRTPTWEIMCKMKDAFFGKDTWACEFHPAEKDYVNMDEHMLHIWMPLNEKLPMPPAEMVGFAGISSEDTKAIAKAYLSCLSEDEQMQLADQHFGMKMNRAMKRAGK